MATEDKPPTKGRPPNGAGKPDELTPSLDELDSLWSDDDAYDEEKTMVAKVRHDLVELTRRGVDPETKGKGEEPPEKHEAITARPPPLTGEASVVVAVTHESAPKIEEPAGDEEEQDEDEEEELAADDLDAGWDIEEERAAAADVAAGLDVEARRKAAEARAVQRRDKARAKKLAAREKRKAKTDAIRQKQKKPKRRSTPPPRDAASGGSTPPPRGDSDAPLATRERPTIPPKEARTTAAAITARRDLSRMILLVALVVLVGALVIGLARR